jgi:hypothetical protein
MVTLLINIDIRAIVVSAPDFGSRRSFQTCGAVRPDWAGSYLNFAG